MLSPYAPTPDYLTRLDDGTVKQLNPFSGTEVWTVAGRGNRPLGVTLPDPVPLDPAMQGRYCPFCEQRYLETPPEKSRMIRHPDGTREVRYGTTAEELFTTVAEFRRGAEPVRDSELSVLERQLRLHPAAAGGSA